MLFLGEADIEALITQPDALDAAARAFRLYAAGETAASVRGDLRHASPKAGCLLLGGARGAEALSIKSNVHAYPDGPEAPRLWGSLLTLWDWSRAEPRALLAARAFNDHRTAAGFAVGADRLAAANAGILALFGAGKSAPLTLRYLKAVRPSIREIRLAGRTPGRVQALAAQAALWPELTDTRIVCAASPEAAVAGADIIATVTTSDRPVFPGGSVRPGACIILGGANRPDAREADDALMRRADLYVDARQGATEKAGDIRLALASGALVPARIRAEIGAVPAGGLALSPGSDVRVFKSMGLAIQDVVLAEHLVDRAEVEGRGLQLDLSTGKVLFS
ncbi:ornithine cyclodeaminase family protein [Rhabdaerophilum sp. SD176]|uniref:ornithine cyclodeaminase family protein n=1 Tax=Rhabdaerophilum sp. SD176 TaxID=2983548 RepID=UPI0024DFE265|nr:ornithine cyclodeaminase family protein [Rhabdaerophilum sp. SD176]